MAVRREKLKYVKSVKGQILVSDPTITEPADNVRIFESPEGGQKYRDISSRTWKTSIDEIRTSSNLNPNISYLTTDFGVPGEWEIDESDTTTPDNTGTVLVTADGVRLKRRYNGQVNIKWFGATGDGITDDTEAIQLAINGLSNVTLNFPPGAYIISSTIVVPPLTQIVFKGDGKLGVQGAGTSVDGISVLQWVGEDVSDVIAIECQGVTTASFKDLAIWNSTTRSDIDGLYLGEFRSNELDNVTISFFRRNLWIQDDHYYSTFKNCRFRQGKEYNVYVDGLANGALWEACSFNISQGGGFYGENMGQFVTFIGCYFEASQGYAIDTDSTLLVNVQDCYFENNGIGIIGNTRAQVRIRPWPFVASRQPARLLLQGCSLSGQQQNQIYARGGDDPNPLVQTIDITLKNNLFSSQTFNSDDPTYVVNVTNSNKVSVTMEGNVDYIGTNESRRFLGVSTQSGLRNYAVINDMIASSSNPSISRNNGINAMSVSTRTINLDRLNPSSDTASIITAGNGSPEGVVIANVGSIYIRQNASDISQRIYVKSSGSSNTGWMPLLFSNSILGGNFQDANFIDDTISGGIIPFINSSGSVNYPTENGFGVVFKRGIDSSTSGVANFKLWSPVQTGDNNVYIQTMDSMGVWGKFYPIVTIGESELIGIEVNLSTRGALYQSISSDTVYSITGGIAGKSTSLQITNTDASPHTVAITGVSFQDGASNSIPAGGRANIQLQQINGVIDGIINIFS